MVTELCQFQMPILRFPNHSILFNLLCPFSQQKIKSDRFQNPSFFLLLGPMVLSVIFRAEASIAESLGNLLEIQILGPHPDLLYHKLWWWGLAIWIFTKCSRLFSCITTILDNQCFETFASVFLCYVYNFFITSRFKNVFSILY